MKLAIEPFTSAIQKIISENSKFVEKETDIYYEYILDKSKALVYSVNAGMEILDNIVSVMQSELLIDKK